MTGIGRSQVNESGFKVLSDFSKRVYTHIVSISDFGPHSCGTVEEKQVAAYILKEFKKHKIDVTAEKFRFESFEIKKVSLTIDQKEIKVSQVCFNPYTAAEFEFEEEFILLEDDNSTGYDIKERIVVASYPLDNLQFFSLFSGQPKLIIVVSPLDCPEIFRGMNRTLVCRIEGKLHKYSSHNIIASVRAQKETGDEIIISAHYDSYPDSPGADDNASGTGVLIELARYFSQNVNPEWLDANLKFVAFSGEEKGLIGARAYLNRHRKDITQCRLLLNLDQLGGNEIFIEALGGVRGIPVLPGVSQFPDYMLNRSLEGIRSNWRLLAPDAMQIFSVSNKPDWLSEIIMDSAEESGISVEFVDNTGSDQMVFTQAGIVSTAIGTSGNSYHNPLDIPSQINVQSITDCADMAVRIISKTMNRFGYIR